MAAPASAPVFLSGRSRNLLLASSLEFFAGEVLGIELGRHHGEWSELVRQHKALSILAARGHGKSGFFSYAYPLWQCWRTENNTGMLVSDTQDQVEEFFRIIKEGKVFVDDNGKTWTLRAACDVPELADLIPTNYDRAWTGSRITCRNGSRIVGATFGKRSRGRHVRWMVVDDPLGDESQYSEIARQKDREFFYRALMPMLLRGGQVVVAGTPMHADDIHGHLGQNHEFVQVAYPAWTETDGERVPLWPEFRPLAWLDRTARLVGTLAFRQEYLLRPAVGEATLFPEDLFSARPEILDRSKTMRPGADRLDELAAAGWNFYIGVDLALSAEVGADYTVIVVLGVDPYGNRWVVDIDRSKGLPFQSQLARIIDMGTRYDPEFILVESNQAQRAFPDEIARLTDLPVRKHNTTAQGKHSMEYGVPGLRTLLENGKLRFCVGDARSVELTDIMRGELMCFSWLNGKLQGVGSHDDMVMALWLADTAVRLGGSFSYWTGADDEDQAAGDAPIDDGAEPTRRRWHDLQDEADGDDDFDDDEPDEPSEPQTEGRAAVIEAAGGWDGDTELAAAIPAERAIWIAGWNSLSTGTPPPAAIARAAERYGEARVRSVLGRLLGVPGA